MEPWRADCSPATSGAWKGSSAPPRFASRTIRVVLSSSKPNLVVVRSSPPRSRTSRRATEELHAREEQAFTMVKAALEAMGAIEASRRSSVKGTWSSSSRTLPSTRTRTLRRPPSPTRFSAVVKLCFGAGARKVIVADNPINNPESCFFKTKVGEAAIRAGAELMMPQDSYFEQLYVGGETITGTWKMFYRPFREATKVIGISPVEGPQPLQSHRDDEELVRFARATRATSSIRTSTASFPTSP